MHDGDSKVASPMKALGSILLSLALLGVGSVAWAAGKPAIISTEWCGPCKTLKYGSETNLSAKTDLWKRAETLSQNGKLDIYTQSADQRVWMKNGVELAGGEVPPRASQFPALQQNPQAGKYDTTERALDKSSLEAIVKNLEGTAEQGNLECLFVRPGQFDEQNESIPQGGGNITVKANMAGYGRSAEFAEPEFGDPESPTNMAIRTDQVPNTMLREIVQKDIAGAQSKIATASNKKITMFVPSATQAQEFVGTSNSGGIGTYKVGNGVSITPSSYNVGVRYPVNPDGTPAIASQKTLVFNKDCEPSVEDAPTNSVDQASNPGSNFGGAPGPGGLGGLESIFPLLMQMMGGGRGQQGGQNPNGSQYPPYNQLNQQQQQQNCAGLVSSPVCGLDKKTYRTACDARNARTSIVGQGECKQPTPTPNIAAISSMIVNQLNASGVPAAILEQVRNTVTSVLGGVFGSNATINETIIR